MRKNDRFAFMSFVEHPVGAHDLALGKSLSSGNGSFRDSAERLLRKTSGWRWRRGSGSQGFESLVVGLPWPTSWALTSERSRRPTPPGQHHVGDISLSDFGEEMGTAGLRQPTSSDVSGQLVGQGKADYKRFEALGIQNLAASATRRFRSRRSPNPEAPVSAAQRLSPSARSWRAYGVAQRQDDEREPVVLSHRSAGDPPQEVDHRERADDGRVQRTLLRISARS